jgi:hypothetical protein
VRICCAYRVEKLEKLA